MRILFDKNVPVGLRRFFSKHEVRTIAESGWSEQMENGELLRVAEESGFDVMVTSDQNIRYQQNLTGRKIALVVLGSNRWRTLQTYVSTIATAIDGAMPGSYSFVEMPSGPKPNG